MRSAARFATCLSLALVLFGPMGCATLSGQATAGAEQEVDEAARAALARLATKLDARVVWSSSRRGHHDLFLIRTRGGEVVRLTQSDSVDWFPRFSPDGRRILFTRSKQGWVFERDSNRNWKWDLWTIDAAGGKEQLVAPDASWGTWLSNEELLLSRNTKVLRRRLSSGEENLLVDSEAESSLAAAELQQPQLSPDGRFLALTLRGARRETGVFDLKARTWLKTGEGCQVNWHPKGNRIYWVNPSGNGGSEVFSCAFSDGRPSGDTSYEAVRFIDLPGRRSHEYFPQMSASGKWLVWAATQRGHDHDIADYEIYAWEIGAPAEEATRLTFHSGNDRWPDIFVDGE
ncbi:MAG: PD40 domain-containing protein [Myxococcales bacterium]|nr:PD40 domain-containing protein [Myxococcales bacterium]